MDTVNPDTRQRTFDPLKYRAFQFLERSIDQRGEVRLRYALLGETPLEFEEKILLRAPHPAVDLSADNVQGALSLLHWVAGISYYKAAAPDQIEFAGSVPTPATSALLEALYSEGLGEFAFLNKVPVPKPGFPRSGAPNDSRTLPPPKRVLVPVGGGKDSSVAIEIVRRSGVDFSLFSVGSAVPILRTAEAAGVPRLEATREIDPLLFELNSCGALNGHVPVTAIVSSIALLTGATQGFDAVALANERSASSGNLEWDGIEVNHQFSKSRRAEMLMQDAVSELAPGLQVFSVLRMASELSIARAFSGFPQYHGAFTSCNRVFRIDPSLRASSWCCDCDKCRFVFLILAPFFAPSELERIFGSPMLQDMDQYKGFALLAASGGEKPFECVGEVEESMAAIYLLSQDPKWNREPVVQKLAKEVLVSTSFDDTQLSQIFALSSDHSVPFELANAADEILGN